MIYKQTICVPENVAKQIEKHLTEEPTCETDCLGINETISYTAKFENGMEANIKCCGIDYEENNSNTAWTEAVLFNNGCQICCSEPSNHYFGEWILEDNNNNTYIVNVQKQNTHR